MEWTTSFDKLVVAANLGLLLSGPFQKFDLFSLATLTVVVTEMFERGNSLT